MTEVVLLSLRLLPPPLLLPAPLVPPPEPHEGLSDLKSPSECPERFGGQCGATAPERLRLRSASTGETVSNWCACGPREANRVMANSHPRHKATPRAGEGAGTWSDGLERVSAYLARLVEDDGELLLPVDEG